MSIEALALPNEANILSSTRYSNLLEEQRHELPDDLMVEATTDMQYLNQYYFIREYAYRTDLKVKTFKGDEDEIDKRSHLIIARRGHFCVGGSRLTISTVEKPALLPLERGDFRVKDHVPDTAHVNYCELGRSAVIPQYRDSQALHEIFKLSIQIARAHQCKYLFGASPPAVARLFQRTFRHLGCRDDLHPEIPVPMGPENEHLKLVFKIIYL